MITVAGLCQGLPCTPLGRFVFDYFHFIILLVIVLLIYFVRKSRGKERVVLFAVVIFLLLAIAYWVFIRLYFGLGIF